MEVRREICDIVVMNRIAGLIGNPNRICRWVNTVNKIIRDRCAHSKQRRAGYITCPCALRRHRNTCANHYVCTNK